MDPSRSRVYARERERERARAQANVQPVAQPAPERSRARALCSALTAPGTSAGRQSTVVANHYQGSSMSDEWVIAHDELVDAIIAFRDAGGNEAEAQDAVGDCYHEKDSAYAGGGPKPQKEKSR